MLGCYCQKLQEFCPFHIACVSLLWSQLTTLPQVLHTTVILLITSNTSIKTGTYATDYGRDLQVVVEGKVPSGI